MTKPVPAHRRAESAPVPAVSTKTPAAIKPVPKPAGKPAGDEKS